MPKRFYDRVLETSTSTGTGSLTLSGAQTQFVAFSARFGIGETFYYCIKGQSGSEWEVGRGYLSSATTLVREIVFESSNSDTFVNFSAGTKDVFNTIPSEFADKLWTKGQANALAIGLPMP